MWIPLSSSSSSFLHSRRVTTLWLISVLVMVTFSSTVYLLVRVTLTLPNLQLNDQEGSVAFAHLLHHAAAATTTMNAVNTTGASSSSSRRRRVQEDEAQSNNNDDDDGSSSNHKKNNNSTTTTTTTVDTTTITAESIHDNKKLQQLQQLERTCLSPEAHVPWVYEGCQKTAAHHGGVVVGRSATSHTTCGLCQQNNWTRFLSYMSHEVLQPALQALSKTSCKDLLLYAVQFGHGRGVKWPIVSSKFHQQYYGKVNHTCAILFVLEGDQNDNEMDPVHVPGGAGNSTILYRHRTDHTALRVTIPRNLLPFRSLRRNVKLLKMHGPQIFPWVDRLVWIDNKLRRGVGMELFQDYHEKTIDRNGVCVAFMAAPVHHHVVGRHTVKRGLLRPRYHDHCNAIVAASAERPTVTDGGDALLQQCQIYQSMENNTTQSSSSGLSSSSSSSSMLLLDDGMIDSALIAWDLRTERCKQFNADLGCTWGDEIQCYSDRDQVSFPQALRHMQLREQKGQPVLDTTTRNVIYVTRVDSNSSTKNTTTTKVEAGATAIAENGEGGEPMVALIQSRCHWYGHVGTLTCKLQ